MYFVFCSLVKWIYLCRATLLYGSDLFNLFLLLPIPTLFTYFMGFDIPTYSIIFIENVFYYSNTLMQGVIIICRYERTRNKGKLKKSRIRLGIEPRTFFFLIRHSYHLSNQTPCRIVLITTLASNLHVAVSYILTMKDRHSCT